jgi:serine/threonine protein kinase
MVAELLAAAAAALGSGEITRALHASGEPLVLMSAVKPGETLVMYSAAKGQFETWSQGLVVKRRYVLRERLGEGGLGSLWSAVDAQTSEEVVLVEEGDATALAVRDAILAERGQGEESERRRWREERFLREVQVTMKLASPNICPVLDHGLQQGRMFEVVLRLQGQSLAEVFVKNDSKCLSEKMAIQLGVQVLGGLEAAHAAGLTHSESQEQKIKMK